MPSFSNNIHEPVGAARARDFDRVRALTLDTEDSIRAAERALDERTLRAIAELCRELVLSMPRGEQGVSALNQFGQRLRSEQDPRHHAASIAANLLSADHARAQAGCDGLMASFAISALQVEIEMFLERHGIDAWGVAYTDVPRFEKMRSFPVDEPVY